MAPLGASLQKVCCKYGGEIWAPLTAERRVKDGRALPTGSKAKCQPGPLLRAPQAQLPSPLPAVLYPLRDSLCWQRTAPRPCTLAVGPPACPAAVPHAWA